jgi:Histidine kinase
MRMATESRDTTRFCVAVYLLAPLLIDASYELHTALGGTHVGPRELPSTFFFFAIWAPFLPMIVRLARRFGPAREGRLRGVAVHLLVALSLSFVTLFAHKIVFCPRCGDEYFRCVTYYRAEPWMGRWFALDAFFYSAAVAGVWMLDLLEGIRQRELRASAIERQLASAEVHLATLQIDPRSLTEAFRWISETLEGEPDRAERMIMALADFLRLNVRLAGAPELTVAEDVDLLGRWLEVERIRRDVPIAFDVQLDEHVHEMPMAELALQPLVKRLAGSARRLVVRAVAGELVVWADGQELARIPTMTAAGASA